MISSETQLEVTQRAIASFEEALAARTGKDDGAILEVAVVSSMESQLQDLHDEVAEWYRLRSGEVSSIGIERWDDLPKALIRARLARGLALEDFAALVGAPLSDVERWEATEYEAVHFARVAEIADVLGVTFSGTARLGRAE